MDRQMHEFFITVLDVRDLALLVDHGDSAPEWLPKSQIECDDAELGGLCFGDEVLIKVPEWLAKAKGMI
ncbi:MAG: hypothetical protein H7831_17945 [Magnetococcus sp. WYHC-3]